MHGQGAWQILIGSFLLFARIVCVDAVDAQCLLENGTAVDFYIALKPPDSYDLHVMSSMGSVLHHHRASLLSVNPVMRTLEPLYNSLDNDAEYLGMPCYEHVR